MSKKIFMLKKRSKRTVLIAAVAVLLLCGTAAASGLLWMKPDVLPSEDGHTLLVNQGYVELPEDAVHTIMKNQVPERNNNCFLNFGTVDEWQEFFGLPFVTSHLMITDETNGQVDYGDGILVPKGSIDAIITGDEDGLRLMISSMSVKRMDEQTNERLWDGTLHIYAALSEEAAAEASSTITFEGPVETSTLVESVSSSGIPYVIRKIISGEKGETVQYFMYYGYESVMYELWITVHSSEEEKMIAEDLKNIADTLKIIAG